MKRRINDHRSSIHNFRACRPWENQAGGHSDDTAQITDFSLKLGTNVGLGSEWKKFIHAKFMHN